MEHLKDVIDDKGSYVLFNNINMYHDALAFDRKTVAHSQKIYVTGDDIHTNNVEAFWSQLKRSIDGTYHHVTARHLQEYADEYSFRYSHRKDEQPMFTTMLGQVVRRASEKA